MAAADYYVTTTGAGDKSGTEWAKAFSIAEFKTDLEGNAEAGDRYFIKEGTYTFTDDIVTALFGSNTAMIQIIGVVSATTAEPPTVSDWATGANRPVFACGAYYFSVEDYYIVKNIIFTGTPSILVDSDDYCHFINCKGTNSSETGDRNTFLRSGYGFSLSCEAISTNGRAFYVNSISERYLYCYGHDSDFAWLLSNHDTSLSFCIADTCVTGIKDNNQGNQAFINNTIYNCTSGIIYGTKDYGIFLNNTISSCTDGFKNDNAGVILPGLLFDYNNWYNNTHDMSWDNGTSEDNTAKGPNATAVDPQFTDAPGGDFSWSAGGNLEDTGLGIELGVS